MALNFHPNKGTVLICDFTTGFIPPEMVKCRPVVVVSPRQRHSNQLCTVVPLSTTEPTPKEKYHHLLNPLSLPGKFAERQTWAKCDMIYRVSLERLDRVKLGRAMNGQRLYVTHKVIDEDLHAIMQCIQIALGIKD